MSNLDEFIEQVRDANPIEDVISESGIVLKGGHTKHGTAKGTQSLIVKCDWGRFFWYSASRNGDVFAWVMQEKGLDFMGALDLLARRAHVEMPKFSQGVISEQRMKKLRATADVYSVAARVFNRFLMGDDDKAEGVKFEADAAALEYARWRGWTDETMRKEVVGFSGRKTEAQVAEMKKELQLFGVDLNSAAAVSIFGYRGDVMKWAATTGVEEEAKNEGWEGNTYIHGLMDIPGLIYAHYWRGSVNYLSRRNLPGFDIVKDDDGDERPKKSHNPNKVLAGPKAVYVNHAERSDRPLICVEGQGDAISFSQLGFGAVAFCGLMGEIGNMSPEEAERLRKLAGWINKHPAVYLFLDDDEAGQKAIRQAAHLLGMKVQIGRMTRLVTRDEENHVE